MAAVTAESATQFRVRFEELSRRGLARLRRREPVLVDPYLVRSAIVEVMEACTVRSAAGRSIVWNEYRVILSRADFDAIGALSRGLDRDLEEALVQEVVAREADLVGPLRVRVVADEADELPSGEAVVRVSFVPSEAPASERSRDARTIFAAEDEPRAREAALVVRWAKGAARLPSHGTVLLGRDHPGAPTNFVALEGASAKINKQHVALTVAPGRVRIARLPGANPVRVGDLALEPGGETEAAPPCRITLSNGDLVLVVSRE